MLSDKTIAMINKQIQDELDTIDSIVPTHQEKMEAIERIAALKALFSTKEKVEMKQDEIVTHLIGDFGKLFRR